MRKLEELGGELLDVHMRAVGHRAEPLIAACFKLIIRRWALIILELDVHLVGEGNGVEGVRLGLVVLGRA